MSKRYVVPPSSYHRVASHEGVDMNGKVETQYFHLSTGAILAQTIIHHPNGSSADIYDSLGNISTRKNKKNQEISTFSVFSQEHFKEPNKPRDSKKSPVGLYWKDFVKSQGGKDNVVCAPPGQGGGGNVVCTPPDRGERMKAFWKWYKGGRAG